MPKFEEYIGGLVDSLSQARLIADIRTAETAQHYAKHEFMSGMSIPRMKFGKVEFDIPLAFESSSQEKMASPAALNSLDPTKLSDKIVADLAPNFGSGKVTVSLKRMIIPAVRRGFKLLSTSDGSFPKSAQITKFSKFLTNQTATLLKAKRLRLREGVRFENAKIAGAIAKSVTSFASKESPAQTKDEKQVIFEASRLREMRPEDIMRVRLVIEEDSMEWHQAEADDGSIVRKLLPE